MQYAAVQLHPQMHRLLGSWPRQTRRGRVVRCSRTAENRERLHVHRGHALEQGSPEFVLQDLASPVAVQDLLLQEAYLAAQLLDLSLVTVDDFFRHALKLPLGRALELVPRVASRHAVPRGQNARGEAPFRDAVCDVGELALALHHH